MNNNLDLSLNLAVNNVFQGDDVFIHGFRLPEGYNLEQFADKLFTEGLRKGERDSILSTIALIPHNRNMEDYITHYVGRGKYRVLLKVPEEVDGLFLGKCDKRYGDAGNQYKINSSLDLLKMPFIPPELIVGIVYTEKDLYEADETIELQFIQNPGYFDNLDCRDENSRRLGNTIRELIERAPYHDLTNYIMTGENEQAAKDLKQAMIGFGENEKNFYDRFGKFIEQRENYYRSSTSEMSEESNAELAKLLEEINRLGAENNLQSPENNNDKPTHYNNDYDMIR